MHGTLHHAADPESAPFVRLGSAIVTGQTLFIMEAMKVFTPVTAPCDGVVTAIHATNGEDVAAGQPLATIGAAG
jgi:acetyl-CoA carboxylase biotin carboxyl carrier protein